MNSEKQIEEMAREMCFQRDSCTVKSCVKVNCETTWLAENLYNAGYRKSTEVAEEIFAEIDKYLEKWISYNKHKKINASFEFDKELYERCEMRIANLEQYQKDITEFKKKYTEGGK